MVLLATRKFFRLAHWPTGKRRISVLAALFSLSWACVASVSAMSVNVELTPAGDVFPALELSQSGSVVRNAGAEGSGLLRIRFGGLKSALQVRLTLSTPGLRAPSIIDAQVESGTVLRPRLDWDSLALRDLRSPRSQVLRVSVATRGMPPIEQELQIRVHPLDEALYFVRDGDARIDLGWAFAAWVDPFDPVVDELISLAELDGASPISPSGTFANRLGVARALWIALEKHGLRYADEGAGISQGPEIYSQRVRLLSSTWDDRVANCLDGSVLIASALERLGIGSFLILVPGHAFVGFYADSDKREAEFLETTFLGHQAPVGNLALAESAQRIRHRALVGFEAARKAGRARYRRAAPRLDGKHRPDYALIDISMARAYGIMPLAVGRQNGSAFLPAAPASPDVEPSRNLPAKLSP